MESQQVVTGTKRGGQTRCAPHPLPQNHLVKFPLDLYCLTPYFSGSPSNGTIPSGRSTKCAHRLPVTSRQDEQWQTSDGSGKADDGIASDGQVWHAHRRVMLSVIAMFPSRRLQTIARPGEDNPRRCDAESVCKAAFDWASPNLIDRTQDLRLDFPTQLDLDLGTVPIECQHRTAGGSGPTAEVQTQDGQDGWSVGTGEDAAGTVSDRVSARGALTDVAAFKASGWAKRVPKSSLRRQTISHRIATHRRPLLSLQDALETSFAPRRALSLTPWRSASPSDLPSLDPQLSDLRHLQASGSPQDLHQLVSKIDSLLDKSALEPTERGLLESEEVWTMYVQAKTELGKQGSVADLVAALQQKSARRAEVLRVGAAGEGQTVEQRLAAYNLTPATLVSSIFSRPGVNASSSAGVSSTNAPVSSNAPPAPPPATPAAAGAMHLDDAHRLNEQFIAAQRSTSSSSSSGAGSQSSHSSSSSQSGPSGSTAGAAAGTAAPGEPIRVIVEENKGSILWRMARFIGVTAVYSFIVRYLLIRFEQTPLTLLRGTDVDVSEPVDGLVGTAEGNRCGWTTDRVPTAIAKGRQRPSPLSASLHLRADRIVSQFNDVHGCDEAKDELQEVVEFLKDPPKFARLGGRLPRGTLGSLLEAKS